jgi:hypothetical protein
MDALEEGTRHLEDGNVEAARDQYKKSAQIQKSAAALFNLGVSLRDSIYYLSLANRAPGHATQVTEYHLRMHSITLSIEKST